MKVSEVMTHKAKTVTPETSLADVATTMCIHHVAGLPVVDEEGSDRIIGMIAEKDLLHYLFPSLEELMEGLGKVDFEAMENEYASVTNLKVKDLMAPKIVSVPPDMPMLRATSVMVRHKFRRIPVVDDGRLVGMLSMGDVHKALFKETMTSKKRNED